MKEIDQIADEVFSIYLKTGKEAKKYLQNARKLKDIFGTGFGIVYCWFFSVPQKWIQIEPKIFELGRYTNNFDLETVMHMPTEKVAKILSPMIFHNEISVQLRNFCKSIYSEFYTWESFREKLRLQSIFDIFKQLRKHKGIRISFKNLAAMKILVGMDDNLIILDRHVAKIFGIKESEQSKYRTNCYLILRILQISEEITRRLRKKGLNTSMAEWSLSIWFNSAGASASNLLANTFYSA